MHRKNASEDVSPVLNQDSINEKSHSVTSNIRQLMSGMLFVSPRQMTLYLINPNIFPISN